MAIPERTEADRASGILRITVGTTAKKVPTLPISASATWIEGLGSALAGRAEALAKDQSVESLMGLGAFAHEALLDAIVAYDRTGALGGREWLTENADPEQLYIAFRQMAAVVFPFVRDVQAVLQILPGLLAAASKQPGEPSGSESSTNGPSPTGDLIPKASKTGSTPTS